MSFSPVNILFLSLIATTITFLVSLVFKKAAAEKGATIFMLLTLLLNTYIVGERWYAAGRPPLTNMYEAMLFFSWSILLMHLIFVKWLKLNNIGFFSSLLALLSVSFASFYTEGAIQPLMPALRSNWLIFHVVTYFISYGALSISLITGLIALFKKNEQSKYNLFTYKIISFSFPFLTLGLISGAIWAKQAWGDYWSWDPKEMWSLITWFLYLNYLHLPYTLPNILRKWQKPQETTVKLLNICAIVAYLFVIFTYLGVNYLLSGLHSYAN